MSDDSLALYTYRQIALIRQIDPTRAAQLRRYYSAMRKRTAREEQQAGLEVEIVYGGYLKELYRRGLVK